MELINENYTVQHFSLKDTGIFPNNNFLDVLLFKQVFNLPFIFSVKAIKDLFKKNNWYNAWKDGIYTYHHYHSITHEVIAIIDGETTIQLGGETGIKLNIQKGDALIIPAGVAHKNLRDKDQVTCIGAYPQGKDYDMNYGKRAERVNADENIKNVPIPLTDPVFGLKGELQHYWRKK